MVQIPDKITPTLQIKIRPSPLFSNSVVRQGLCVLVCLLLSASAVGAERWVVSSWEREPDWLQPEPCTTFGQTAHHLVVGPHCSGGASTPCTFHQMECLHMNN
ncbi:uncharacterized protein ACO6RY_10353 [Pungitius sinensis]